MENRAKEKDHHRSKIKTLTLRLTTENKNFFDTWAQSHGCKNLASAFDYALDQLRMQDFQPEEQIVEIELCRGHSIIINHPELVKCLKEGRNVSLHYCMLCYQHKKLRLPMTTIPRLEAKITDLETRCKHWKAQEEEAKNEALEADANTTTGLLKQIEGLKEEVLGLKEHIKRAYELLEEKKTSLKNADSQISEKDQYIKYVEPFIEPSNNFHSAEDTVKHKEPLQTQQQIPEKAVESQPLIERITKEKEITEKFGQPKQSEEPNIPSEDLQTERPCPKSGKKVGLNHECHICQDVMTCPSYGETVAVKRALGKR